MTTFFMGVLAGAVIMLVGVLFGYAIGSTKKGD